MLCNITLQLPGLVKLYTYHYLYDGTDFLADVGGYLGLFLGFSVFTLVEAVEKYLAIVGKRKDKKQMVTDVKT